MTAEFAVEGLKAGKREAGLRSMIVSQFRKPHGALGVLAGWIMATRKSNIERNLWTVDLLNLRPGASVLEVGCGPGTGVAAALEAARDTHVTALDHSALMIAQAARRNRTALKTGRLKLCHGELEDLPDEPRFDAVFSCNVLQFEDDHLSLLAEVQRRLKPGGSFATTYQPRGQCATVEQGRAWIGGFAEKLCHAGFEDVDVYEKPFGGMTAFCALAGNPGRLTLEG